MKNSNLTFHVYFIRPSFLVDKHAFHISHFPGWPKTKVMKTVNCFSFSHTPARKGIPIRKRNDTREANKYSYKDAIGRKNKISSFHTVPVPAVFSVFGFGATRRPPHRSNPMNETPKRSDG